MAKLLGLETPVLGQAAPTLTTSQDAALFNAYARALDQWNKLHGVYAPTKVELTKPKPEQDLTDDDLDREIAHAQQEINRPTRRSVH